MTTVWLNGGLVAAAEARIDITDRGFLLADGLFETMLAKNGVIERLDAHLARLEEGAAVLKIPLPFKAPALAEACQAVLEANGLKTIARAGLRLTLTRGPAPRGVLPPAAPHPTVLVTAAQASAPPASMMAITARTIRRDAASPLSRVKSLAYTGNILARIEADAAGASEALILNTEGNLAETTSSNVFLVENGALVTPSIADGALPGMARAAVIDAAKELGISVSEASIPGEALRDATEIFVTNSLIGVCPLTSLDGRALATGAVTSKLSARLSGD